MIPNQSIVHLGLITLCLSALPCAAQDIEPRRWSHLPLGANFAGAAYAYTEGDIFINNFGFKIAYVGIRTREDFGSENDTLSIGCSLQW